MKLLVAGLITLLVAGCGGRMSVDANTHAYTIPLIWKPTKDFAWSGTTDTTGRPSARVRVDVTDNRGDPEVIGRNSEQIPPRKVITRDSVTAFVSEHMKELIAGNGNIEIDDTGPMILKVEVQRFLVEETETYNGDVRLKVTLVNSNGTDVWTGITRGASTRFGRSYSAENYYEALSDSLVDAVRNLLRSPTFHSALDGTV